MKVRVWDRGLAIWLGVAAIVAAAGLVACSSERDGAPPAPPAPSASVAPAPVAPAAVAPVAGAGEAEADEDDDDIVVFVDAAVTEGPAPLTVTFEVELEGGVPPIKWSWDYGDGQKSNVAETTHQHTFTEPGAYRVDLEVEDAQGESDFDFVDVVVRKP